MSDAKLQAALSAAGVQRLGLGADHAGYGLKGTLATTLASWGLSFDDLGTNDDISVDYPDYAHGIARGIVEGRFQRGILVCGTGVGMSIAANRHPGVRAVVCSEPFSARMSRAHNDANVLCLGARVVGSGLAVEIVRAFLESAFEGDRHQRRVGKIELD